MGANPMSSSREQYQKKQRLFAAESTIMIAVNLVLAIAATVALVRLVSHNIAQQETVDILDAEVAETQERVRGVREEFSQYFDPQQTKAIMRQRSHRVEAGQAHIIFIEPEQSTAGTTDTASGAPMPNGSTPDRSMPDDIAPSDFIIEDIDSRSSNGSAPDAPLLDAPGDRVHPAGNITANDDEMNDGAVRGHRSRENTVRAGARLVRPPHEVQPESTTANGVVLVESGSSITELDEETPDSRRSPRQPSMFSNPSARHPDRHWLVDEP